MLTRRQILQSAALLPLTADSLLAAAPAHAGQAAPASTAAPAAAAPVTFADFENGWGDWVTEGDAFGAAPATDALFPGKITGFGGRGFVCTLHPRRGCAATGKATSPEFTIEKPFITFKIGGGNFPGQACLNLVVEGQIARTATGNGTAALSDASWDVSALVGKKARLEIVDATTSPERGYIMVDDIAFESSKRANFSIRKRFVQRVEATLRTSVISTPTIDGNLRIYAPVPPNTPVQTLLQSSLGCPEYPAIQAVRVKDVKNANQDYLCLNIPIDPGTLQRSCTVEVKYELDLFEAKLTRGISSNELISQSADELEPYTRDSTLTDYKHEKFQSWMKQNQLLKRDDEGNLDFGYRIFKFLYQNAHQGPNLPSDQARASILCDKPIGDCGAMTILLCATLAANGVPIRALPGRWAHTELENYGQYHANCEVYEASTGWVPLDMAFAVGAVENQNDPDRWYGFGEGKFIAFSAGMDNCPEPSVAIPLNQFMIFIYKAGTSAYRPKYEDHWAVTCLAGRPN